MPEVGLAVQSQFWAASSNFPLLRFIYFIHWKKPVKKWNLGVYESLHHQKLILPFSNLLFNKNYRFSGDTMKSILTKWLPIDTNVIVKVVHIKVDNHFYIFILAKTDTNSRKNSQKWSKKEKLWTRAASKYNFQHKRSWITWKTNW